MTNDDAFNLITEWLSLANEVSDMSLNRATFDEHRYNYAINRVDIIRHKIYQYYDENMKKGEDYEKE